MGRKRLPGASLLAIVMVSMIFGVIGCALPRNPVPLERSFEAEVVDFPGVRYWEIDYKPSLNKGSLDSSDCSFLGLSGGGANGAFGAGFLCGWTASGKRPNFRIVTGISTGALIAPLAFVGSKYDQRLTEGYTTVRTKDILDIRGIWGILGLLWSESYALTEPLTKMIEWQADEEVFKEVAKEHAKGRRLYIGTTNLDAQRFRIWDMGAIASSGHPDALKLFRKIMLASASIPGAFPPVYFDVEVDGKQYDEMHADGGVITEVFGYGPSLFRDSPIAEELKKETCSIYIIRNGKLATESQHVRRKVLSIAIRSFSTLMKAHSWLDLIRLYSVAKDDGVDFNYVSIPDNYVASGKEPFDPVEMKRLYDLGFDMAKSGYDWRKSVPGFGQSSDDEWIWTP